MSTRGVTFTDVFNFRDLGGYRTADGLTTRWQRLYRSDDLSRLRDSDHDAFLALGVRTVVDLRRPTEIAEVGRCPELDGVTYHHVHLAHPFWPMQTFADTAQRAEYVVERYREMSDAAADGLGEALRIIADQQAAPVVFHCIAGKDRTGVVAALTLSLLGVDDDVIADDYALSEVAEPAAWQYYTRHDPTLVGGRWTRFTVSPREAMLRFLTDLRSEHGSVQGYAARIGVTHEHITAMRAHLLEP